MDMIRAEVPATWDKFQAGDEVWVAYNVNGQPGWTSTLNSNMAKAQGKSFKVVSAGGMGYGLDTGGKFGMGQNYYFAEAALVKVNLAAFEVGASVLIMADPEGWSGEVVGMTPLVRTNAVILELLGPEKYVEGTGPVARLSNGFSWPLYALQVVKGGTMVDKPADVAATTPVKKKKRVRVGEGPWDAAPCTHLRWHLMGFFREKLALVKSEGGPSEVRVKCTKCNCEMTLQAK